jgi:hypothetical protein
MAITETRGSEPEAIYGFLQLCADKRFHRKTMTEFESERAANLGPEEYWIEAAAGGAPAFGAKTLTAIYAYTHGARKMGWAAHGDECGGFPGTDNAQIRAKLEAIARERFRDFPLAEHWFLFGAGDTVVARKLQ